MNDVSLVRKLKLTKKYPKTAFKLAADSARDKFKLHNEISSAPNLIVLYLSETCNLRCPMCSVWQSRDEFGKKAKKDTAYTLEDVKKIVKEVESVKPMFYFVGGEPTLNRDLISIIKYIHSKGMITSMTTNGWLLAPLAQQVFDSGLDFISISLDGPNADIHDKSRGVKRAFEHVTEGIKKLVDIKRKNNSIFPNIKINSVITPWNIGIQEMVIKLVKELGVDEMQFGNFSFYSEKIQKMNGAYVKRKHTGEMIMGMLSKDISPFSAKQSQQIAKFMSTLPELSKKYNIPITMQPYTDNFEEYYKGTFPSSQKSWCYNPWHVATIRESGDLEVCQGYVVGNIKENKLMDLWNNEKFRYFRNIIKKEHITPACYRCCNLNTCFIS